MLSLAVVLVSGLCFATPTPMSGHHVASADTVARFRAKHDDSALFAALFAIVDSDSDGSLTGSELSMVFHNYDKNGDGWVSEAEFVASLGARSHHLQEDADELFQQFDVNKDSKISSSDLDLLFAKMDPDTSGKVSANEFSHFFEQALQAAGHFDHHENHDEGEEDEQ